MRFFGIFGEKKKTLEEKAKEFRIILGVPSGNDYEHCVIKGAGESVEAAQDRLLENTRSAGGTYLSKISSPEINERFKSRSYVIKGIAYRPIGPKVA